MAPSSLETEIGSILAAARESLAVARARCYAMGPTGEYRLAGSFGFGTRFGPEDSLDASHPLVDWVHHHRRAAYANAPADALRLRATMEREQYARMLAAPVYVGSRLVGILELQDKQSGAFFTSDDLRESERIAERIADVLESYGAASVADEPMAQEDADALFRPGGYETDLDAGELPPPPALFSSQPSPLPEAGTQVQPPKRTPPLPTRREELVFRGFWTTLLLVPEIEAVAFSSWSRDSAEIQIGTRRPFSDAARAALLASLETALSNAMPGVRLPSERRFTTEYPVGRAPGEIATFGGIQTSVLSSGSRVRLLTLLFTRPPEAAATEALKETHRLVRAAVLQSVSGERYRQSFRSLVKAFIEPGLRSYPQLKAHSFAVGALCRKFATSLKLPADVIEQLTVAGLLHDIGLREVEVPYERLSGRRPLDLQEVALVRRHAPMGADILERIDFPYPVAPLVRHHHERYDGAGYPDGLSGDRIPFGARMIAIAEAFDAMTAPHSYRATVPRDAALETLVLKSGTQFDPDLARLFNELIRSTPDTPAAPEGRP